MKKNSYLTSVLLLVAVFVVLAAVSEYYFFRFDLTEGGQYSLSKATKNILKDLDSPVTVTAYFTEDLAPDLAKVKDNLRDMLVEYNSRSGGKVLYNFKDPSKDKETETEALQAGIQPVLFNAREKDEVKQQKVFMGAVIRMHDQKEVLPFIEPKSSLEYSLSTAIKKLSVKQKPKVGFIQGHGEPPPAAYQQLMAELKVLYDVQPVMLSDQKSNLNEFKTLVVAAPTDTILPAELQLLDNYLEQGGNIMLALKHVAGDLTTRSGKIINTGFEGWLKQKGLVVEDGFLVDSKCGSITVRQQTNFGIMTSSMKFPYFPLITDFADNPATKGLEQVLLTFAAPIRFEGKDSDTFIPLASTSKQTGILKPPVFFDVNKKWTRSDFEDGSQVVAGMLESKTPQGALSRIIVVGNGDFAYNGTGQQPERKQADNISLMANFIDYLSDDTGLITLRTKTITSRPIEQLEETTKAILKWLNFLLPILLVIIYGLIRAQFKRNQRLKRMGVGYVK